MSKRFYVDDVPLARNMDEFPPEVKLDEDGNRKPEKKQVHYSTFETAPLIRDMRRRRGVSQADLSERVCRSRGFIAALENRHGSCRFDTIAMIARALGFRILILEAERYDEIISMRDKR